MLMRLGDQNDDFTFINIHSRVLNSYQIDGQRSNLARH